MDFFTSPLFCSIFCHGEKSPFVYLAHFGKNRRLTELQWSSLAVKHENQLSQSLPNSESAYIVIGVHEHISVFLRT